MGKPTELLHRWKDGDEAAIHEIIELLYGELRIAAVSQIRKHRDARLQPTELVNEAYLKLRNLNEVDWQDRVHFIAMASKAMQQVLLDIYRKENANKRAHDKVTLVTSVIAEEAESEEFEFEQLVLAMEELASTAPDLHELVSLKFFGGLTHSEIAEINSVSTITIKRRWRAARAWLFDRLVQG